MSEIKQLVFGKTLNFASIEDMNAVCNGEMSMEEAAERFENREVKEPLGFYYTTKVEGDVVTFDVLPSKND